MRVIIEPETSQTEVYVGQHNDQLYILSKCCNRTIYLQGTVFLCAHCDTVVNRPTIKDSVSLDLIMWGNEDVIGSWVAHWTKIPFDDLDVKIER